MAKLCECCGGKNNFFVGDPFYLTDDKILCHKCAQFIRDDINKLYYVKTNEEYEELENQIIFQCKKHFSDDITEYVIIIMNKIYERLDFVKKEKRTISVSSLTNTNSATNTENLSFDNETEGHSGMFDNIGHKIKTLAQVITWIGIVVYFISGLTIMFIEENMFFIGLLVMVFGALISWVSSFVLYGFGQLVENSDKLVKK